ncbi:MAG TPA: carboxylesterase family protein [Caulobacteraceae bacterium]|jgi:para-nitrobenzyl esterase|nr:carboxylesterase family protein [Caulobacteraceae bacterium]
MNDGPVVETRQGKVRGAAENGVLAFRGLPFAASTEGDGRFAPPRPAPAWSGIRDATTIGFMAPQNDPEFNLSTLPEMSEDCLNLNVFTPAADGARRPVLFYIHAGAFVSGGGGGATQNGSILAVDEDVVVVTINYRLGVFGWPPFRARGEAVSNNLGLLDQIAALEWVRDNIAAFGGDPGNVTVFGYSAGGWSILALMAAPQASGLFHKAAPQSGSAFTAASRLRQDRLAADFLSRLAGAPEHAGVAVLLEAQKAYLEAQNNAPERLVEEGVTFGPWRDGIMLADDPLAVAVAGKAMRIPLLIGSTADELGYAPFRAGIGWLDAMHTREASLRTLATAYGAGRASAICDAYRDAAPDASDAAIAGHIRSDRYYRMPAIVAAEAQAAHSPTWMYQFTLGAASEIAGGISTHATDLAFWFGTMAASPLQAFLFGRPPTEAEQALSRRMRRDLAQFARTGRCEWPAYAPADRVTRMYGLEDRVALDPGAARRRAWPAGAFLG